MPFPWIVKFIVTYHFTDICKIVLPAFETNFFLRLRFLSVFYTRQEKKKTRKAGPRKTFSHLQINLVTFVCGVGVD